MKTLKDFLEVDLSEEEITDLVEQITWEDIIDLYESDELYHEDEDKEPVTLSEKISASSRMKKSQQAMQRKQKLQTAKKMKLKRPSTTAVLTTRAKAAARRMIMKKLLKGRNKASLSAQERDRIESRVKQLIANQPGLIARTLQKVKGIERTRLSGAKKK